MNGRKRYIQEAMTWAVIILRMVIGAVVMKTGFDLAAGKIFGDVSMSSDPVTPLFIIILGVYFCFSGLLRKLFGNSWTV